MPRSALTAGLAPLSTHKHTFLDGLHEQDLRAFSLRVSCCCRCWPPVAAATQVVCTEKDQPYLASRNNPLLKVPDGMTQPNRAEALAIPEPTAGRHTRLQLPG